MVQKRHPLQNRDAGDHPLPTDRGEIEAVLGAWRRSYETHPYLARRYGARGEAFTRSDGGYLVTLTNNPKTALIEQVEWLATLLANRGMPRLIMETHLELLFETLSEAVPNRIAKYRKLLTAAQKLRQERQSWIAEIDFLALAADFEKNAGGELENAGGLIVSAVCDSFCGLDLALPSLVFWLGDASRFSSQWCAAVENTAESARALASQARPAFSTGR
ncbi:MAG TPA: hypothetical protein HPP80_02550 [Rhodospirillaceae bacterium]|nr:hypothetical protein [Rhodospirillaceae bacterium]